MFRYVRSIEMKLKLFWKQSENVNPCNFSSSDLLQMDVSINVPILSISAVEIVDSLPEN
jgi:hypothetical protein